MRYFVCALAPALRAANLVPRPTQLQDSGSDSDPLADELNIKDKIKSFIPEQIAKQVGLIPRIEKQPKRQSKSIEQRIEKSVKKRNANGSQAKMPDPLKDIKDRDAANGQGNSYYDPKSLFDPVVIHSNRDIAAQQPKLLKPIQRESQSLHQTVEKPGSNIFSD